MQLNTTGAQGHHLLCAVGAQHGITWCSSHRPWQGKYGAVCLHRVPGSALLRGCTHETRIISFIKKTPSSVEEIAQQPKHKQILTKGAESTKTAIGTEENVTELRAEERPCLNEPEAWVAVRGEKVEQEFSRQMGSNGWSTEARKSLAYPGALSSLVFQDTIVWSIGQ